METRNVTEELQCIPQDVRDFLLEFYNNVVDRNLEGMRRLYEHDFNQLSETHYKSSRWPLEDTVDKFYRQNQIYSELVTALYRELYYRHLIARCPDDSAWPDRVFSSVNYIRLFEYFVAEECKPDRTSGGHLPLPLQWQWDMMDEFVYQYQETQRWKEKFAKDIAANEVAMKAMREGNHAWRATDVLGSLTGLIHASGVKEYIEQNKKMTEEPDLPITLGYFAIISLMRLHVSMGDYRSALDVGSLIELSATALYWKVPATHITLFYNLGFSYMMIRRYHDAIRVLSQILVFLGRSRSYLSTQSYQQDAMIRMTDRMYHLVMLCNALGPTRLDESIQAYIQDHLADKHFKLQSDEDEAYREVFLKACPKFFNPFISEYQNAEDTIDIDKDEPTNRQLSLFLRDVSYQNRVFNVRSIAKLYNNLTLAKLANLMGLKQENAVEIVRSEMLCVKNRSEQLLWKSGSLLSGERAQMLADLNIYLDLDTIHVKNLTTQRNHVDYFIKQIHRTQDLLVQATAPSRIEARKVQNGGVPA